MLSFGHAAFFACGAYGATFAVLYLARDPWLALVGAVVAATALGALVGVFAVRVVSHSFVIITITFSLVLLLLAHSQKGDHRRRRRHLFPPLTLVGGADGPSLATPLVGYYMALAFMVVSLHGPPPALGGRRSVSSSWPSATTSAGRC